MLFRSKQAGARVAVVNRSVAKGEALARELDAPFVPLAEFNRAMYPILVHTTSVGMTPHADAMPFPECVLEPGMVVMDIVYNPLETRLLRTARKRGCVTVDGVAMFVYQGAFQFELWTGKKAPAAVMRETVMKALEKRDD